MKFGLLGVLGFTLLIGAAGCGNEPSRWDQAATATLSAPASPKIEGAKLNAAFPADGTDGYSRVFTAEKEGFVEAKLKKDGQEAATLSISDAAGDSAVTGKFASAADKVSSYPLITVGKNQSAVLVNNRFQVKVSSQTLDPDARKTLLSKFNLDALAKL